MKTTLNLDDNLLIKAKTFAAQERKSLTALIEEGLRLRIRQPMRPGKRRRSVLPVYPGKGGLARHIDPLSNRSLYEAADDDT